MVLFSVITWNENGQFLWLYKMKRDANFCREQGALAAGSGFAADSILLRVAQNTLCRIFIVACVLYNEKSIFILLQNDSHSCLTPLQLLQQQIQASAAVSNGHSNMNNSLNGILLHNSQSSGKHIVVEKL